MIYFLLHEERRLIEIGTTRRLNSRLARRRGTHGGVLRVLAVIDGDVREASEIRGRFADLRVRAGWHRIDPGLTEYIGREGRPWSGGMRAGKPAYHDRLAGLAAVTLIPAGRLVDLALSEWADHHGFSDRALQRERSRDNMVPRETLVA